MDSLLAHLVPATGTITHVMPNSLLLEGRNEQGAYYRMLVLDEVRAGERPLVITIGGVRYTFVLAEEP